ncbi:hypothetical protein [Psychrobacter sp. BF1]|uniref:hypothetical protein n=1 Tax=Psychrobacter sp. BF1 TaxID=2821147 RepID=UPI001C4E261E|nr:hypothetical protein [Psychrobacter sp. BF1]
MSKISLIVGNGLSMSFGSQSGINFKFNSQQPLNWNVICPSTGGLLMDNLPSLKKLWGKNFNKPHFDVFGFALDKFYCNLIGIDSCKTTLEARHFLTIAFSEYSLLQSSKLNSDWAWFQWFELHQSEIKGSLSFNYDLLLESVFDKIGIAYHSSQVNHIINGIPLVKPHGSVDFEMADGMIDMHIEYPLNNFIDLNNAPIKRLQHDSLLYPRKQAHCIIPNEANKYKNYQWVSKSSIKFNRILKESDYCIFIGISYLPSDQVEIDRIINTLSEDCEIIIANPYPPKKLLAKIRNKRYTIWSSLDGPIDESGNLYNLK